jgi:hypothetical protein
MLKTLQSTMPQDPDYPARTARVQWLESVLNGSMYDCLKHEFHEERERDGTYIPLAERRPSVRYNLSRIIVSDSVSMLFSEGHFPTAQADDEATADALRAIVKDSRLNEVMIDAAMRGSVGSVAVLMRVLGNRVFFSPLSTCYLTPEWKADAPDTLASVTEQYKVRGDVLAAQGYTIPADDMMAMFWFRRVWDEQAETWFLPWKVHAEKPVIPEVDTSRTVTHGLGFVPMVWVRNLPGGDDVDGACTFEPAIPSQIEIEYQLSQAGRGLKYSSDPLLMIKEPPSGNGDLVKGGNALIVSKDGDAKLLEINGSAAAAVIEYARALRAFALESVGGNRADADKLSAAQSGRAMELMNQALIWLADKLRASYGEGALLDLLHMVVKAAQKFKLVDKYGRPLLAMKADAEISLNWPRWYAPTATDRKADAETLKVLKDASLLSQETAITNIADDYDVEDVAGEMARIDADSAKAMERLAAVAGPGDGEDEHGHMPMPKGGKEDEPKAAE